MAERLRNKPEGAGEMKRNMSNCSLHNKSVTQYILINLIESAWEITSVI